MHINFLEGYGNNLSPDIVLSIYSITTIYFIHYSQLFNIMWFIQKYDRNQIFHGTSTSSEGIKSERVVRR